MPSNQKKLLFSISICAAIFWVACKSKQAPPLVEPKQPIEYPRPATDGNLDSLKKVLDGQRKNRIK